MCPLAVSIDGEIMLSIRSIDVVVNRPPVREMCLNYEVVEFQPCTVTPPHLGSVTFCYTLI